MSLGQAARQTVTTEQVCRAKQVMSRKTADRKPQSHYTTHSVQVSYDEAENIINHIQERVQKKIDSNCYYLGSSMCPGSRLWVKFLYFIRDLLLNFPT